MGHDLASLLQRLSELVATPSVSSFEANLDQGNRAVIDLLAGWLSDYGFACSIEPLPEQPHKANLIATLEPLQDCPHNGGLALCGHTDTVPCNPERWSSDPFTLTERDSRLFGLGASDMKGFLALAVEAAGRISAAQLSAPLVLVFTADEESGMAGARALLENWPITHKPRQAIIGEPTANRPVHIHKGIMMEAIHIAGRSGHSSNPALGHNALEDMSRVMQELLLWRQELSSRCSDERFTTPYPTLNLGYIHGGDNPNRICAAAELHFDLRPLPGMEPAELRSELRDRLQGSLGPWGESSAHLTMHPLTPSQPPLATPREAAIVQLAEQLSGHQAQAVAFATEAPYFTELGMDVVVLGPGDIDCAHQPDESLALERLEPMSEMLHGFIRHFCMADG